MFCNDISKNNIQVMLEGHGRMFKDYLENVIDVVGWFTSEYPINFDVKRDLVAQCDEIERRMLAVPNNGLMYSKVKNLYQRLLAQIYYLIIWVTLLQILHGKF